MVASVNTHDMPSFAAHWNGLDIDDRVDLGLIAKKDIAKERENRELARKSLVSFLRKQKLLKAARPSTRAGLLGRRPFRSGAARRSSPSTTWS